MQPNILVIETDPAPTDLTVMLLQAHGLSVIKAYNNFDALRLIRENQPRAIILEPTTTDEDGLQICHAIREFSTAPIMVLSAINDPTTIAAALDSGADDYLVKPVASEIFLARLTRLIKRTGYQSSSSGRLARPWLARQLTH